MQQNFFICSFIVSIIFGLIYVFIYLCLVQYKLQIVCIWNITPLLVWHFRDKHVSNKRMHLKFSHINFFFRTVNFLEIVGGEDRSHKILSKKKTQPNLMCFIFYCQNLCLIDGNNSASEVDSETLKLWNIVIWFVFPQISAWKTTFSSIINKKNRFLHFPLYSFPQFKWIASESFFFRFFSDEFFQ